MGVAFPLGVVPSSLVNAWDRGNHSPYQRGSYAERGRRSYEEENEGHSLSAGPTHVSASPMHWDATAEGEESAAASTWTGDAHYSDYDSAARWMRMTLDGEERAPRWP